MVTLKMLRTDAWLKLGLETAAFPGQSDEEVERLLHMVRPYPYNLRLSFLFLHPGKVVVGGGPTGIELRSVLASGMPGSN